MTGLLVVPTLADAPPQNQSLEPILGKRGKSPGSGAYAGWPRQRMRSGRGGTAGCPDMPSLFPR